MLRAVYKVLIVFGAAVTFFFTYNTFLLDRSLEELKFSLDMMAEAETVEDTESVKIVLEMLLSNKLALEEFDSSEIATLEYAHNVMVKSSEDTTREIQDAVISIKAIVEKKASTRRREKGNVIAALDRVNSGVINVTERLRNLPATLMAKEKTGKEIDTALLGQAKAHEGAWSLSEAKEIYEKLIRNYPDYKEIKSIELKLAYVCQKLGLYDRAEKLYNEIAKRYINTSEAKTAGKLLVAVREMRRSAGEREAILRKLPAITDADGLQKAYFKLGMISMCLLDIREAKKAFSKVIEINPSTEIARRAFFNIGWCHKTRGELDESISTFEGLIEKHPDDELVLDSRYQLASVFHHQGNTREAILQYERIAEEYGHEEAGATAYFYTSATYFYDEGDLAKAREEFFKMREKYPYMWIVKVGGDYSEELLLDEKNKSKRWRNKKYEGLFDNILSKGATGFTKVVLNTSRPEALGTKTPYTNRWTEKEMNNIVNTMASKAELSDFVTSIHVDFKPGMVELSASLRVGVISAKAYGQVKAEAFRGGLRYTVEEYRFTFGNTKISIPVPGFVMDRITSMMNKKLTRKGLLLSVEELELTDNTLIIEGFRF